MNKHKIKILLAAPRGFCAGVDRTIEMVKKSIDKFGAPVYVRHEIVHNNHVVENFKKIGAIFVEELSEIKDKTRPVIFSAHGVLKSVPAEAENLEMTYVDATMTTFFAIWLPYPFLAKAAACLVGYFINFVLRKYLVFRELVVS